MQRFDSAQILAAVESHLAMIFFSTTTGSSAPEKWWILTYGFWAL
jgi:hypothetical protein